jgi:energy-converting hydrogenase B subunit D
MLDLFNVLLVLFLIVCAIAVERTDDLLGSVILFAAYSLVMAVLWLMLAAPDIALTEAAIGAGVTTMLFLTVISRTRRMEK